MKPRLVLWLVLFALALSGCGRKAFPADSPVVESVTLEGSDAVSRDDVLAGLATAKSPRFLGIWDGVVFDYEVFDDALLERDLERIERYYRARGFYEAKVTAARVVKTDDHHVRVELRVHEGPEVLVEEWRAQGLETVDIEAATAASVAVKLRRRTRFDEADYEASKKGIVDSLANHGYAFAKIVGRVTVDVARHTAKIRFDVTPGPRARYGRIDIVGLKSIPEGPVRENLDITEGAPYEKAELDDAKTALVNLGVFANVDVRQDLSHPESGVVPVKVVVSEAPLRTLKIGGGMRLDVLEWSSNLTFGWEHKNFLGGMRRFSIESKPGVVFFPTSIDNLEWPRRFLPRNRVRMELRQPSFIEGRTTGFVAAEFNVYPVLYPDLGKSSSDPVIGYLETKAQTGAERAFFAHHLYVTPSYNWQANVPFAYLGTQKDIHTVFLSFPELDLLLDFRDDPIEPHRGALVSNVLQVAGNGFGGDVSDVKVQPEVRTYVPISKKVTFATRATVGFLFPQNYGSTLASAPPVPPTEASLRDQQILLLRAFYSGGPTSNRGYPFRGVGPHGVLGFLLPSTAACKFDASAESCQRPLGGLTLWEASAEARFPIWEPLRGALFIDASDVSREVAHIRFDYPHLSPGFGLRYGTPVGPVRLDVGYRIPFVQEVGTEKPSYTEGNPGTIFGLPIAIHIALGESF
ncbi:MAG TPA: BamA/TamA family outer membrane protein [Polyangiaceae bacterium]|nr:BamA/TamA family outer membrane protein [Polyangiaceae bacterium]